MFDVDIQFSIEDVIAMCLVGLISVSLLGFTIYRDEVIRSKYEHKQAK